MLGKKRRLKKISKTEPSFLSKLYQILSDKEYYQYIHWSHDGLSVIISDSTGLTKKVLPKFYNHHNYASFVRQLNMYNFRKIRGDPKSNDQKYVHSEFYKGKSIQEIQEIRRKIKTDEEKDKNSNKNYSDKKIGTINHNNDNLLEDEVGVVNGMAYTVFGGDILPIEVNYFKGKGAVILTGHLGDVMKESASIALDYVKSNAELFQIDPDIFQNNDIHIHVPEGAVPKDGPSAGVAMTCAIISCLSKRPVSPDVAMTGEVTLRGQALPIGGLREKSLAALRCGIKTIIVPKENKKDVDELPQEVKDNLKIVFMSKVEDAVEICFVK